MIVSDPNTVTDADAAVLAAKLYGAQPHEGRHLGGDLIGAIYRVPANGIIATHYLTRIARRVRIAGRGVQWQDDESMQRAHRSLSQARTRLDELADSGA